jgi:hypothetical protein
MTRTTDHLATMGDEDEAGAPASAEHARGGQCPGHPAAPRQASAESAIAAPLVTYGTDPGYSIPDPVAMQGMPRGAVWTTASTDSVPQCPSVLDPLGGGAAAVRHLLWPARRLHGHRLPR